MSVGKYSVLLAELQLDLQKIGIQFIKKNYINHFIRKSEKNSSDKITILLL